MLYHSASPQRLMGAANALMVGGILLLLLGISGAYLPSGRAQDETCGLRRGWISPRSDNPNSFLQLCRFACNFSPP